MLFSVTIIEGYSTSTYYGFDDINAACKFAYAHKDNFVKISCNDTPIYGTIIEEEDGRVIFGNILHSNMLK